MLSEQRLERLDRWCRASDAATGYKTECTCPDDPHNNVLHDLALEAGELIADVIQQRAVLSMIDVMTRGSDDVLVRTIRVALEQSGVLDIPDEPELAEWTP